MKSILILESVWPKSDEGMVRMKKRKWKWRWQKRKLENRIQKPNLEINAQNLLGRKGNLVRTPPPPPSTCDTIHPIDLKFGTYSKLHLYFQLNETTWCLFGFHGNNSQINDVTCGRHLGFSNFQILFRFSLFYLRLTGKHNLAAEIHEIDRIHCEAVSI